MNWLFYAEAKKNLQSDNVALDSAVFLSRLRLNVADALTIKLNIFPFVTPETIFDFCVCVWRCACAWTVLKRPKSQTEKEKSRVQKIAKPLLRMRCAGILMFSILFVFFFAGFIAVFYFGSRPRFCHIGKWVFVVVATRQFSMRLQTERMLHNCVFFHFSKQ